MKSLRGCRCTALIVASLVVAPLVAQKGGLTEACQPGGAQACHALTNRLQAQADQAIQRIQANPKAAAAMHVAITSGNKGAVAELLHQNGMQAVSASELVLPTAQRVTNVSGRPVQTHYRCTSYSYRVVWDYSLQDGFYWTVHETCNFVD